MVHLTVMGLRNSLLRLTAPDLHAFGVIDEIISEPPGGAHADPAGAAAALRAALETHIAALVKRKPNDLLRMRAEKYRNIGQYAEG